MKVLALILSIYILGLNLVPCEDGNTFDNEVKTELTKNKAHDHDHQESDSCSPFCQCHCCHIHITHFKIAEYNIANNTPISTQIFYHFEGIAQDFSTALLQPPQV